MNDLIMPVFYDGGGRQVLARALEKGVNQEFGVMVSPLY
jgi:hypothetical protein